VKFAKPFVAIAHSKLESSSGQAIYFDTLVASLNVKNSQDAQLAFFAPTPAI